MTEFESFPTKAKWAFSARRIPRTAAHGHDGQPTHAKAGDLILGQILSVGQHARMQLAVGRYATLYPGDLIVMPCGARYAPDQFEGIAEIDADGCDMLAGGGCLGRMQWRHDKMKVPTRVLPLGRITDENGKVLSTEDFALQGASGKLGLPVIAVVGTSMNSGKTTAAVALSRGLTRAGWKVGALKATGTGSFGDFNDYVDTGACFVGDFTDAGMTTTYLETPERICAGISTLTAAASRAGADIVVMEIADGIFQRETSSLLSDTAFRKDLTGIIFACGDAVAAAGGVMHLKSLGLTPLRLTGLVSCSPMASAEAHAATGIEIIGRNGLLDPAEASALVSEIGLTTLSTAA